MYRIRSIITVTRRGRLRRAPRQAGAAGAAAATVLMLLALALPEGAAARTRCSFHANVVTITVDRDGVGEIVRDGTEIVVREADGPRAACAGGAPTVLSTETIKVRLVGLSFADLDLTGGAFAPGLTPEAEGASEIEVEVSTKLGALDIQGTAGADVWHWGSGGANPALNLNPGEAGDSDLDVTVASHEDEAGALVANGAGGDDTIVGAPGAMVGGIVAADGGAGDDVLTAPRIDPDPEVFAYADLDGGSGDDVLTGAGGDDELDGGPGSDRLDGRGGADKLVGGRGRDRLTGGAGNDTIASRDFSSDTVRCGAGRDRADPDRRDRLSGCERTGRR